MNTWAPLFSKIVDSSLWDEDDFVVKIFITMLAKKDADHIVRGTAYNIAQWAKKPKEEARVIEALKRLANPDKRRLEPQPFEGRRIEKIDGIGYLILNGQFYEDLMRAANRREYKAQKQREYRARNPKTKRGRSVEADARAFERSIENGEPESEQDKIVTNSLPEQCQLNKSAEGIVHDKKEFENWGNVAVPETVDQLPDAGKVMVPNGTSEFVDHPLGRFHVVQPIGADKSVELAAGQIVCDRCNEAGHKGEDCPIPAHLEGGKWVRD